MPMFLHQWIYKSEQVDAIVTECMNREEVVRVATEAFGGKLHHFFFCFGDYDGMAISEFPDQETALACLMTIFGHGGLQRVNTTVLLSPEQSRRAVQLAWQMINDEESEDH